MASYIFWFFMRTIILNGLKITLVNQKQGKTVIKAEEFCLLSWTACGYGGHFVPRDERKWVIVAFVEVKVKEVGSKDLL